MNEDPCINSQDLKPEDTILLDNLKPEEIQDIDNYRFDEEKN